MRERLFPRWGAALFALLPLSEILYTPVNGQTMYAAVLASLICALLCAGGARLAPLWQRYRVLQWLLALAALWPLTRSLARMGIFLRDTAFPSRPLWSLILLLTICTLLAATAGLNRCAILTFRTGRRQTPPSPHRPQIFCRIYCPQRSYSRSPCRSGCPAPPPAGLQPAGRCLR